LLVVHAQADDSDPDPEEHGVAETELEGEEGLPLTVDVTDRDAVQALVRPSTANRRSVEDTQQPGLLVLASPKQSSSMGLTAEKAAQRQRVTRPLSARNRNRGKQQQQAIPVAVVAEAVQTRGSRKQQQKKRVMAVTSIRRRGKKKSASK
jgi:hypothetical protein